MTDKLPFIAFHCYGPLSSAAAQLFQYHTLILPNPTHISISQKKINRLQLAVFDLDEVIYESLCAPNTDCIVMD